MRRALVIAMFALAAHPAPAFASRGGWDDASTVVRDVLVVGALGVPLVERDGRGLLEAGGSMGAAGLETAALKQIFPETRPDGSDDKSFPSGHSSVAFAAAATLENRYGWHVGLPAHVAAAFVAVARVEARKHHWYDALAGAALGEANGLLITGKRDARVKVFPWAERDGGGVVLAARF